LPRAIAHPREFVWRTKVVLAGIGGVS